MSIIEMRLSPELLGQLLDLRERTIVDAYWRRSDWAPRNACLVLRIDAPDAPAGTAEMEPRYLGDDEFAMVMVDPGWLPL